MSKDTIHMIFNDDGDALYLCSGCQDYLTPENFHHEKRLKHRGYCTYKCKECINQYNKQRYIPITPTSREDINFIMEKLGYDTSDLENNPIHVQFDVRYQKWLEELPPPQEPEPQPKVVKQRKTIRSNFNNNIKIKDMTPEQRSQYNKEACRRYREKYYYYAKKRP